MAVTKSQDEELSLQGAALEFLNGLSINAWPVNAVINKKLGVCHFAPNSVPLGGKADMLMQQRYSDMRMHLLSVNLTDTEEGPERKLGYFASVMTAFTAVEFVDLEPNSDVREIVRQVFEVFDTHPRFDDVRIVTKAEYLGFRKELLKRQPNMGTRLTELEKLLRSFFSSPWSFRENPRVAKSKLMGPNRY